MVLKLSPVRSSYHSVIPYTTQYIQLDNSVGARQDHLLMSAQPTRRRIFLWLWRVWNKGTKVES